MMGENKSDELTGSIWDITAIFIGDGECFYTGSFFADGCDYCCLQSQKLAIGQFTIFSSFRPDPAYFAVVRDFNLRVKVICGIRYVIFPG